MKRVITHRNLMLALLGMILWAGFANTAQAQKAKGLYIKKSHFDPKGEGSFPLKGVCWFRLFFLDSGKHYSFKGTEVDNPTAQYPALQSNTLVNIPADLGQAPTEDELWCFNDYELKGGTYYLQNMASGRDKVLYTGGSVNGGKGKAWMLPLGSGSVQQFYTYDNIFELVGNTADDEYVSIKRTDGTYMWLGRNNKGGVEVTGKSYYDYVMFKEVPDPLLQKIEGYLASEGAVGGWTPEELKPLRDAYNDDNTTRDKAKELIKELESKTRIQVTDYGYYRIKNAAAQSDGFRYWNFNYNAEDYEKGTLGMAALDNKIVSEIYFVGTANTLSPGDLANGMQRVVSELNHPWQITGAGAKQGVSNDLDTDKYLTFKEQNKDFPGRLTIVAKDGQYIVASGMDKVTSTASFTGAAEQQWYLIPATSISITAKPYASFSYPFNVTVPEELEALKWKNESADKMSFEILNTNLGLSAGSPVVVKSKSDKTDFTLTIPNPAKNGVFLPQAHSTEAGAQSVWEPYRPTTIDNAYIISNKNPKPGLHKLKTNVRPVPANKVYFISAYGSSAGAREYLGIEIFNGETTGISAVEESKDENRSAVYYDLTGRRVAKPTRGLYIDGNGKKFMVK